MVRGETQPRTLAQAREMLSRSRPARDAEPSEWITFHRHCAQVYGQMAKVDARHQHEATQYAAIEIRRAREIEHELDPTLDDES